MNKYEEALAWLEEECRSVKQNEAKKYIATLRELIDGIQPTGKICFEWRPYNFDGNVWSFRQEEVLEYFVLRVVATCMESEPHKRMSILFKMWTKN